MSIPSLRISLTIYHCRRKLDSLILGTWGNDLIRAINEKILKGFPASFSHHCDMAISVGVLKYYAHRCMEELVVFPEMDFLAYTSSLPLALPTFFTPLIYFGSRSGYAVSSSSIAVIGEGIAGFIAENIYDITLICRPIGISPDLLGVDKNGIYYFIEAKATTSRPNILNALKGAVRTLIEIIKSELSAEHISRDKIAGMATTTYLESVNMFKSYVLELVVA